MSRRAVIDKTEQALISYYQLEPHPEGGYFRRIWSSPLGDNQERAAASHIYYLLEKDDFSAFHRIDSDELWHHYSGDFLEIYVLYPTGNCETFRLGKRMEAGESPTVVIPAGVWFAAKPCGDNPFAFVGCTVVPEFSFSHFELANAEKLSAQFPEHRELIEQLCRG